MGGSATVFPSESSGRSPPFSSPSLEAFSFGVEGVSMTDVQDYVAVLFVMLVTTTIGRKSSF